MDYEHEHVLEVMFTRSTYHNLVKGQRYPDYTCSLFYWTDIVQFKMQMYIVGHHATLHRISDNTRTFLKWYPDHAPQQISFALWRIEYEFLKREWYELMPRYQKIAAQLKRKHGILPMTDEELKTLRIPLQPLNYWSLLSYE